MYVIIYHEDNLYTDERDVTIVLAVTSTLEEARDVASQIQARLRDDLRVDYSKPGTPEQKPPWIHMTWPSEVYILQETEPFVWEVVPEE